MFRRLLIANRGEIARRINRVAQGMGLDTVAVYSDADAAAPPVDHRDGRRVATGNGSARCDIRCPVDAQHFRAEVGQQHPRELHRPDVRQMLG